MRAITKRTEPSSLTEYRASGHSNYEDFRDKKSLRASLVLEQRGLCCYCLSRIWPNRSAMRIEHWHPQQAFQEEVLDYSNLLGACLGGEGQPQVYQYCDVRKGERLLSRNPADSPPKVEDLIRYYGDGRITSDDLVFDQELNDVLNLNTAFLKNQRKAILEAFKANLDRRGHLSRAILTRWVRDWNGELNTDHLQPFCQVVVYWLRKRLDRGSAHASGRPSPRRRNL